MSERNPIEDQVLDDSAAHSVAEYRAETTSRRRCCQPRRRTKGRSDFTTMVSTASSQDFTKPKKKFFGYYKHVKILCPKQPNTSRICIPLLPSIWSHIARMPNNSTCENHFHYNHRALRKSKIQVTSVRLLLLPSRRTYFISLHLTVKLIPIPPFCVSYRIR